MDGLRSLARPLLAGIFIAGGLDALRHAEDKVPAADPVAQPLASALPVDLPSDTTQLVRINAAVQVVAGASLALGVLPRVAAAALAVSIVPTTFAGHRFWEADDPATKAQQRIHFLKNAAILGGLVTSALDTGGRPSLPWRVGELAHRHDHG